MKRIILPLILCAFFATYSYADLNPFAYGLSSTLSADKSTLTVNYSLNATATAISVIILDGTTIVKTVDCAAKGLDKGTYTIDITTDGLPKNKDLTWKIEVKGKAHNTTNNHGGYRLYHPSGVDVDNNPESSHFGRIICNEAMHTVKSKTDTYLSAQFGAGIFEFTPTFEPKPNGNKPGYNGGITFTNTRHDDTNAIAYAPRRVRISEDGRIFVSSLNTDGHVLWEVDPDNLDSWTEVIAGTSKSGDINSVVNGSGTYIGGPNVGMDVRGKGTNLQLAMLSGIGTFQCNEYDLGTAKSWDKAPSRQILGNQYIVNYIGSNIEYDNEGGIWFCQYRGSASTTEPAFLHINTEGEVDYSEALANVRAGAFRFNPSFTKVITADGRNNNGTYVSGYARIYNVSKDANGNPLLTLWKTIDMSAMGSALNDFAWDIADNIYVVGNDGEWIRAYALARTLDDIATTPAASKYTFNIHEDLNIYASGLRLNSISPENRKANISYFLNAPATAVEFQLINHSQEVVHSVDLSNHPGYLTKGEHNNVEIDLFGIPTGDYTWAIKATANTNSALTKVNDHTQTRFNFYSPQGLAVDNHPNSPYFGRIYVAESRTLSTSAGRAMKEGIYIFDATLEDVTNQGNESYAGGVAWNEDGTNKDGNNIFYGMYGPARMSIDEDGFVYICDNGRQSASKNTSGVWRMDPSDPTKEFDCMLDVSKRGEAYTRVNSIAVTGSGEDRTMYILDYSDNIVKFEIGNKTGVSNRDAIIDTKQHNIVTALNTLVRGKDGDFWVFQYRGVAIDAYPVVIHYNASGQRDFYIDNNNNSNLTSTSIANRRGNGAVSPDGKYLAFNCNDGLFIYSVTYDANGVPSLSNRQTITAHGTGKNVEAIAFDVANNLYFASASTERFYAFALPKANNTHTTPAPSSQSITLAEPVPHIMAYNLDVKQNGKYYNFSFYANSDATSGKLLLYDHTDAKIGEINIEQAITKGNNTIQLLTHELPEGSDMTWKLQLTAPINEAFGVVYESSTILQRAHAAIDNTPESNYFGRIYILNSGTNKGCYIYDYDYSGIKEGDMCGMTDISTSGRPAVDSEGYVYWADYGESHGGIYVMNPETFETHSFFVGEKDDKGLWTNGGVELGSSCSGASIYGSGANTILFATSEDSGGEIVNDYAIYQIGQNDGNIRRTWNQAPTQKVELDDNMNANGNFTIVGTSRGTWLCQNRSNGTNGEGAGGARSLIFCGKDGRTYYRSTEGYITGSQGSGMAVSADESKLAMVTGTGDIFLFDLNWTYDNTAGCELPDLILSKTYRTKFSYISSMHFDYAGNLVTMAGTKYGTKNAGSDDMRLVVFSTPTDNNTTTIPARTRLTVSNKITLLDAEDNTDLLNEHKGQIQNASVFRSLTAGMYNTLCLPFNVDNLTGTPLEDATVWQYNGATVENEATNKEIFLNFEEVTAIEAGKPYLVEPATNIAAPMEFKDVTISVTNGSNVAQSAVTMHGILHPTELQANDKSILFLVANNNLAWANVTANMNGMRAYFKVNDQSLLSARTRAYIRKAPTVATDMENITTTDTEIKKVIYNGNIYIIRGEEVYTIQGTRIQ